MTLALYRKYRPTSFAEVVDQQHIVTTLTNEIKQGNIAHAYLFSGPRGVGKTTMARLFAKAINSAGLEKLPVNSSVLDIIEIDAASHTGVDNVRENIIQNAYVVPSQLKYKVFIIDEVHMLSGSAFNALLKILEEPPEHVIFILATTEVHRVPATVVSRCQRFDFHVIPLNTIVQRLRTICVAEQKLVDEEVLERIAQRAGGAMRDAESLLGQVLTLEGERITMAQAELIIPRADLGSAIALAECLLQRQAQQYLQSLHSALQAGAQLKELQQTLLEVLRQGMLYTIDQSITHFAELDIHAETQQRLVTLMQRTTTKEMVALIDLLLTVPYRLADLPVAALPLEVAGLSWCTAQPAVNSIVNSPAKPVITASVFNKPLPAQITINTKQEPDSTKLANIKQHWSAIITAVKQVNHALAMTLSVAKVVNVYKPNILMLGVRYDFHRERLMTAENLRIIEQAIQQVTQQVFVLQCTVGEQYTVDITTMNNISSDNLTMVAAPEADNVWNLAAATFNSVSVK
ncbi:MAG: DNA polymerase III subunit gamma/tau [Patescibacteria group bacterium]|jgi:DNA polymerase-3 subunit gamma/tau